MADPTNVIMSMGARSRELAVAGGQWVNELESEMSHSIYWIYEDFTRDYVDYRPPEDWPCAEVGNAVLELMLSNWSCAVDIRNHGSAVSRLCSFRRPELAVLIWHRNCLRLLSEFKENELDRIAEALHQD